MSTNLNYVPWMSLFTVIGIGVTYLTYGIRGSGPEANVPLLYGAAAGAMVGVVVRTVVRIATRKKAPPPTDDSAPE